MNDDALYIEAVDGLIHRALGNLRSFQHMDWYTQTLEWGVRCGFVEGCVAPLGVLGTCLCCLSKQT